MRIEQLTYFLEVAKTHSINKAAENLFVTQPGLSDSIKKMEGELGLKLLHRSKTGVSLTENGKVVAQHALTILDAYQDMLQDLALINSPEHAQLKGTITIATPPLFAASVLTDVNTLFRNSYPQATVRYLELTEKEIIQMVKEQRADLGFYATSYIPNATLEALAGDEALVRIELFQDELVVCMSHRSPLTKHKSLPPSVIRKEKMVTFLNYDVPTSNNVIAVSNNIFNQVNIILQQNAISLVTKHAFERCFTETPGLVCRPLEPAKMITFSMLFPSGIDPAPEVTAYIQLMREHILKVFGQIAI